MNIYKIALTGGPCAGKTEVLKHLKSKLKEDGYHVITIPETATYLIDSGTPPLEDPNHAVYFQNIVLNLQLAKERAAEYYCEKTLITNPEFFEGKKGIVILYDRGIMDNRAYLNQKQYEDMFKNHNLNELEILYSYDLVLNLISLATTNPELYQLDGIRYETPEKAAERDLITSSAWLLHPNLKMIKPQKTLEDKLEIVDEIIYNFLNNVEQKEIPYIDYKDYHIDIPQIESPCFQSCTKTYYEINSQNDKKNTLIKVESNYNTIYTINNKCIKESEFLNLLNLDLIKQTEKEIVINFILEGNHYRVIKTMNSHRLYAINNDIHKQSDIKVLKRTRRK